MRAWLEQPHGRRHKAPPQPCVLTTNWQTLRLIVRFFVIARDRRIAPPSQAGVGLVEGSRGPTQIYIRGLCPCLCHWAGEPAGHHLGADSPSRRAAERRARERQENEAALSALAPRALPGAPRECGAPTPPCSALRLLSSPAHSRACPFAVARATQVYRRKRNAQPAGHQSKSHRPRAVRPPGRYGRVRAIRDSPSDVAACHRVVRRHTCCSPATRRPMRATQARGAAPPRLE